MFPKFKYDIFSKLYEVKDCCRCLSNVSELYFDWNIGQAMAWLAWVVALALIMYITMQL